MNRCNRLCDNAVYLYVRVSTAYDIINYMKGWQLKSMAVQII